MKLNKEITNIICVFGSNIIHMKNLLKKKYVSKKELRRALETEIENLNKLEKEISNFCINEKLKVFSCFRSNTISDDELDSLEQTLEDELRRNT